MCAKVRFLLATLTYTIDICSLLQLNFWRRYVDDTCTALPSNLVDSFHDHLNSIDPCIQFTIERESDGQLPFLDILLNREEDGSISTSVYRKATHMHRSVSVLSLPPPCSPQTGCGEDTDVQSRGPLVVRSDSCPGREAGIPGPPGKWLPQGFHTQAHLPTA